MSSDWNPLLDHLAERPREDGTPALAEAATWLAQELHRRGLEAEHFEWIAHPWRLRTLGVVALLGAGAYVLAMMRRRRALAFGITLGVSLAMVLELDYAIPLLGWLHSVPEEHLVVTVPAAQAPTARLLFSAHYDTKTDLLDHVERAPINFLGLPFTLLMLVAAALRPRPRLIRAAYVGAVINGVGLFLAQTGGAFVSARSPGAIDDGASCAVLLELGSALKAQPLEHTEVKLVFFSGEEIGMEGSRAYVAQGLDRSLPLQVINLDGIGESSQLVLFKAESGCCCAATRLTRPSLRRSIRSLRSIARSIQRRLTREPFSKPGFPRSTCRAICLSTPCPATCTRRATTEHA